ncbi:transcriptional regulator [Brevibacillus sp. NPDC058079]|uniref:helix-turn-helix transcriptional regulator n=1 Tax=Brevibacillus sp. NPDC058079 TaxID=3346330 RepID=UPI0036F015D1
MNFSSNSYQPNYAIPPGETIQEVIEDRGISIEQLSTELGLHVEITKSLLSGIVRITPDIASGLETILQIPKAFWLNLERSYNETLLRLWDVEKQEEELN